MSIYNHHEEIERLTAIREMITGPTKLRLLDLTGNDVTDLKVLNIDRRLVFHRFRVLSDAGVPLSWQERMLNG